MRRLRARSTLLDHTLALSDHGDVYAWGHNRVGQLGLENHPAADAGNAGKGAWLDAIKAGIDNWHRTDGEAGLNYIVVGTKTFGREVAALGCDRKAPLELYHGDSDEKSFSYISATLESTSRVSASS